MAEEIVPPEGTGSEFTFVISDLKNLSVAHALQLGQIRLFDENKKQISILRATNPSGNCPSSEGPANIYDASDTGKWLDFNMIYSKTSKLVLETDGTPVVSYDFKTANDAPERDPKTWKLLNSNGEVIDQRDVLIPDKRFTYSKEFVLGVEESSEAEGSSLTDADAKDSLTLVITAVKREHANSVQLAQIRLFGKDRKRVHIISVESPGGDFPVHENPSCLSDPNGTTKWVDFSIISRGETTLVLSTDGTPVLSYDFQTANDCAQRDPKSWKVFNSKNELLDSRENVQLPDTRFTHSDEFVIGNTTSSEPDPIESDKKDDTHSEEDELLSPEELEELQETGKIQKLFARTKDKIPKGSWWMTVETAKKRKDELIHLLEEWDLVQLDGGRISGWGYGHVVSEGDYGMEWIFVVQSATVDVSEGGQTDRYIFEYLEQYPSISQTKQGLLALHHGSSARVNLKESLLRDEGAKVVAKCLESNTTCTELLIGWNKITCTGAAVLAESLKTNSSLQILNLEQNEIGSSGGSSLVDGLTSTAASAVTQLVLTSNKIDDEGIKSFVKLVDVDTSLVFLRLDKNNIGADGILTMADAVKYGNGKLKVDLGGQRGGNAEGYTRIDPHDLPDFLQLVGKGEYGMAFLGVVRGHGKSVIKVSHDPKSPDSAYETLVLQTLPQHENVCTLFGIVELFDFKYTEGGIKPAKSVDADTGNDFPSALVVELHKNGSLQSFAKKSPVRKTKQFLDLALGMAKSIQHLHEHDIIHRDIATRNFVLSDHFHPVLIDFGLSCRVTGLGAGARNEKFPFRQCAPEVFTPPNLFHKPSDVWMLGIAFWQMVGIDNGMVFRWCNSVRNLHGYLKKIHNTKDDDFLPYYKIYIPEDIRAVIKMCCRYDVEDRLTIGELVEKIESMIENNLQGDVEDEKEFEFDSDDEGDLSSYALGQQQYMDVNDGYKDVTEEEEEQDEDAYGGYQDVTDEQEPYGGYLEVSEDPESLDYTGPDV